jgi:hypothetical protein
MLDDSVLDLDPIVRAACAVGTVPALRHKTLKPEIAGLPEQVRADLALFELANENTFRPPCQQPRQVVLRRCSGSFRKSSPSVAGEQPHAFTLALNIYLHCVLGEWL